MNISLLMIKIYPREIDRSRRVWIENIFPSSVSGIKLQFRIFTGKLTMVGI